eukprot:UN33880
MNSPIKELLDTVKSTIHVDPEDLRNVTASFLRRYSKAEAWKTERRTASMDSYDVVKYVIEFEGGQEIASRFDLLYPSFMMLSQALGLGQRGTGFFGIMSSGEESKKYQFAQTCSEFWIS